MDAQRMRWAMRLEKRRVLITGASSGIGEATAHELGRVGAELILVARRKGELERVAAAVEQRWNVPTSIFAGDILKAADRKALAAHVDRNHGSIDVLINNAGITAHGRFDETTPDVMRQAMELNFFATAELTQALLPVLLSADGERMIVLVSTPSGLHGIPGRFAYSASKAAGHAWMETIGLELADKRIHTLVFCPGYTRTNLRTTGLGADGSILSEEQARGAADPETVARKLRRSMEKRKRLVVTDLNGRAVYWLRTLAPGLLRWMISKKLKKDFQNPK